MSNFIAVPAADIENLLQRKGFTRTTQRSEVVYIKRSVVDRCLMIKVYTSISIGQAAVRSAGRDAIKVCVVWDNEQGRSFGVGKFNPVFRVHSVQSVLERLEIRLKEAGQRAREWLEQQGKVRPAVPVVDEDTAMSNAFAENERLQEQAAFMSDPDLGIPQDPPSEPPAPAPQAPTFEEYARTLEVPF